MKALLFVFAMGGLAFSSRACLNEYKKPAKTKAPVSQALTMRGPNLEAAKVNWHKVEVDLRHRAGLENAPHSVRSDYAVALLHLGRTKEALRILESLAKRHPNEYRIVANLGTAYELDGQLELARTNIARAMELKPSSHEGTEWLHLRILDAKMALAKDPNWLATHSVVGHDFGKGEKPVRPATFKSKDDLSKVTKALVYQLTERLQFVRPPDATVADMLFDLGNVYALSGQPKVASAFYGRSLEFGDLRKATIEKRTEPVYLFNSMPAAAERKRATKG